MTAARLELRLPPLLLAALGAAAMYLVAAAVPVLQLPAGAWRALALLPALAGAAVAAASVLQFRRVRTTVDPRRPARSVRLVTGGVYRLSRNPMYLGFLLWLAAWALWLAHPLAALALPGFVLWLNRFQIGPEEAQLRRRFGTEFAAYAARTRRWI